MRLNHDVTTSDRSVPTPKFLKIYARLRGVYIWNGFVKHSKWGLRLNHDVTTSDRSAPTPKFLNIVGPLDSVGVSG